MTLLLDAFATETTQSDPGSPVPLMIILSLVGICSAGYAVCSLLTLRGSRRAAADRLHIFSRAMKALLAAFILGWLDVILSIGHDPPLLGRIVMCLSTAGLVLVASVRWLEKYAAPMLADSDGTLRRRLLRAASAAVADRAFDVRAHARRVYDLRESATKERLREAQEDRHLGPFGRFGLALLFSELFTVGVLIQSVLAIPSSESAVFARSASLYGAAILLCMTPPVALAWLVLCLCHGRPRVIQTLKRVAEVVGIGTMCGLLLGSVAFAANLGVAATDPLTPSPDLSFDLLFSLSLAGAACGFGLSHFVVVHQAASGLSRPVWGWVAGPVALGTAVFVTQHGPFTPRVVGARLIDAATRGVVVPANVTSLPTGLPLWRSFLVIQRDCMLHALPTPLEYGAILVAGALVLPVAAALRTWRATCDESDASPYDPRHAARG